jgi:large-conductance mechanosensitive channel
MSLFSRIQLTTLAFALASILGLFAIGFAGIAGYEALQMHFDTPLAALLTAIAYLLIALIILAVVKVLNRTSSRAPTHLREGSENNTQQVEELTAILEKLSDPVLADVIKKHPGKSLAATLAAGVIFGYSQEARSLVKSAYKQYFDES